EYALVLRIDGEIQSWGLRGGGNIRFRERQRMVTTDIYVPSTEWLGAGSKLREFLANEVTQAVLAICAKAKSQWSDFDSDRMIADVARAVSAYRATS
ncbi:MAG: hypothetical protein K0M73_12925, partial [Hydrogenophaga sp.]|nr:hypothetical protein [Hydrogenophaga sp.]